MPCISFNSRPPEGEDFYEKEGDGDTQNRSHEIAYYVRIAQPVVEDEDNDILYDIVWYV